MRYLNRFLTALQFYSRLPLPWQPPFDAADFAPSLMQGSLVGLLLGILLAAFSRLSSLFLPPLLVAAHCLVLYYLLSGGLHLDGLGDTFDGLGSGRDRARMLEIMRDSRIGSSALLAVSSVILCNFAALASLASMPQMRLAQALLLSPMLGRTALLISAASSVYARTEQGLGRALIDYCSWAKALPWLLLSSVICFAFCGLSGLSVSLGAYLAAWLTNKIITRKLGGATGDTLGAVLEITQTVALVLFVLAK